MAHRNLFNLKVDSSRKLVQTSDLMFEASPSSLMQALDGGGMTQVCSDDVGKICRISGTYSLASAGPSPIEHILCLRSACLMCLMR